MNYLYINTADCHDVQVGLINSEQQIISTVDFSCEYQFQIKDKLLKAIKKILSKKNIVGIAVLVKSAQMTSLRLGVATANALAYSLNLPIVGFYKMAELPILIKDFDQIKKTPIVVPEYEKNPMLDKKSKNN